MFPVRTLVCAVVLMVSLAQIPGDVQAEVPHPDPEPVAPRPPDFEVEEHDAILINGEAWFTIENGVVGGCGTAVDPYIIQGWAINTSRSAGITIMYTSAHFIVRDCYIFGNRSHPGIVLSNVTNGKVESCYISNNSGGICSGPFGDHGASYCKFTNNSIVSNKDSGLAFYHTGYQHVGNIISSNNISDNGYGISAIVFRDNAIKNNIFAHNKKLAIAIGICVGRGGGNRIHHNNFLDNNNGSEQCLDEGNELQCPSNWNDSSQGNFWSDWTGPDDDGDGIVDIPCEFEYKSRDNFPLARPVEGIGYRFAPPDRILPAPDRTPPGIFDLAPANSSLVESPRQIISANFSDGSGIDLHNSSLLLDGLDISQNATWTCGSVRYEPHKPWSGTIHNLQLAVTDNSTLHNQALVSWSFTALDKTPPWVFDLAPANGSVVEVRRPAITANFSDESGIYPPGVSLFLDFSDVTGHCWYSTTHIEYWPPEPLGNGIHNVRLTMADGSGNCNLAIVLWSFMVELAPVPAVDRVSPKISGLMPDDSSRIADTRTLIAATYNDSSGIDIASIRLSLDGKDVTSGSVKTPDCIMYQSSGPLAPGEHSVQLTVGDLSTERNVAAARWNFTVVAAEPQTPPIIDEPNGDRNQSLEAAIRGLTIGVILLVLLYINYKRKH